MITQPSILAYVIKTLPQFIVTVACAIYLFKTRNIAGSILLIGSLLLTFVSCIPAFAKVLALNGVPERLLITFYVSHMPIVEGLGGLAFAAGFLLLAIKTKRRVA